MIILKIARQDVAQVTLVEDDDVVETFATDRANDALDIDPMGRWIATGALAECGCNDPLWRRPCKL